MIGTDKVIITMLYILIGEERSEMQQSLHDKRYGKIIFKELYDI